jgi:hypothetical protein
MRPNEGVLRHLFGILRVAQELIDHRVNAIPIAGDHLVEGGMITAFEAVYQNAIEGNFLSFGRHTFFLGLMGIFLDCSQDLRVSVGLRSSKALVK